MIPKRFLIPLAAAGMLAVPASAVAQETRTTTTLRTTTTTTWPSTTSTTEAPAPTTTVPTVVLCIQGVTTTGPLGATNPTGIPYHQGPCDEPTRVICLSGIKTITVTREEEDTIGEPYTLGPCVVRATPRFTG